MLKIDIVTIFPRMFSGPFDLSIVKRAQGKGLVEIEVHDLRRWTEDKRGTVDDRPYGGGAGMVMKVEPIAQAINSLKHQNPNNKSQTNSKFEVQNTKQRTILTSPRGRMWSQEMAREFSQLEHLIIVCGHYEGVDERVTSFIDEEISIGDYVLTGGEIPAMVIVDTIVRLIPGVLKKESATIDESFSSESTKFQAPPLRQGFAGQANNKSPQMRDPAEAGQIQNFKFENTVHRTPNTVHKFDILLEYPQYTHPKDYRGLIVPPILLSGNHAEVEKWRKKMAKEKTTTERPDLSIPKFG